MVNNWLKYIHARLRASSCTLCHASCPASLNLCHACHQDLPWLGPACKTCALPLTKNTDIPTASKLCGRCIQKLPPFSHCHCLFSYDYPVDQLITRLKFHQKIFYGRMLGQLLATYIKQHYPVPELPEAIVPVPLHSSRLRERGFNQAYEIAAACAKNLGIPLLAHACIRSKATDHQLGLSANTRRKNLSGAFKVTNVELSGCSEKPNCIALIDDVMTTGSTLNELATSFTKAGVSDIHAWCVARTVIH